MSEKAELSVPEIVEKLFEGGTVVIAASQFASAEVYAAFLNHVRTAKSRTTKKFRAIGMEFNQDQMILHSELNKSTDMLLLKLAPPKTPKYTVIVFPAEE